MQKRSKSSVGSKGVLEEEGERKKPPGNHSQSLLDQFPTLCTCDDCPLPTCKTCTQTFGTHDSALLPDICHFVAWRIFNPCKKCGGKRPSGCEDQVCFGQRTRKKPYKGLTQKELLQKIEDGSIDKEEMDSQRVDLAIENYNFCRISGEKKVAVKEEEKKFEKKSVRLHFSYLDDYLYTMAPDEVFTSTRAKVAYVNDVLETKVIRNKEGHLGVEERNLPQGVAYEIERGIEEASVVVKQEDVEDEDDAAIAQATTSIGQGPQIVGDDQGLADVAGVGQPCMGMRRCNGKTRPRGLWSRGSINPVNQVHSVASVTEAESSSAPVTLPLPRQLSTRSATAGTGSAAKSVEFVPLVGEAQPRPMPQQQSRFETSPPAKSAVSTDQEPSVPEEDGDKVNIVFSKLLKKKMTPAEVLDNGKQLKRNTQEKFTMQNISDHKFKAKAIPRRAELLRGMANRCAGTHDEVLDAELSALGMELADLADDIVKANSFFTETKQTPLERMKAPLDSETNARVISKMSSTLAANTLTVMCSAAITKLDLAARPLDACVVLNVLGFGQTAKAGVTIKIISDPKRQAEVHRQMLIALAEKSFKLKVSEYVAFWSAMITNGCLPPWDRCALCTDTSKGSKQDQVAGAVVVDLAFLSMSVEILRRAADPSARINILFDTTLTALTKNKSKVSLKLRTFRGKEKRADGDGDVGRRIWKVVDELIEKAVTVDEISQKTGERWAKLVAKATKRKIWLQRPSPETMVATVISWSEQGFTHQIRAIAEGLSNGAKDFEGEEECNKFIDESRKWLVQLLEYLFAKKECAEFLGALSNGVIPEDTNLRDVIELAHVVFNFWTSVDKLMAPNRKFSLLFEELENRFDLVMDTCYLIEDEVEAAISHSMSSVEVWRRWSSLWVTQSGFVAVDGKFHSAPHNEFLGALRSSSIENLLVTKSRFMFSLDGTTNCDGTSVDSALMCVGDELQNLVPARAKDQINACICYGTMKACVRKNREGKEINMIELFQGLYHEHLVESTAGNFGIVSHTVKVYQDLVDLEVDDWLRQRDCSEFQELHEFFGKSEHTCKTGDANETPWMLQDMDANVHQKMMRYDKMQRDAFLVKRSVNSMLMLCPASFRHYPRLKDFEVLLGEIVGKQDEIKMNKAYSCIGNVLLKNERGPSFQADLKKTVEHCSHKYGFTPSKYPQFLKMLYDEATGKCAAVMDVDSGWRNDIQESQADESQADDSQAMEVGMAVKDEPPLKKKKLTSVGL